jgi:GT2 family glycosyltransferase
MNLPASSARLHHAPLVTVIIVNFNGGQLLSKCLDALNNQECKEFSTVIVDNDSNDDSVTYIQKHHPHFVVLSTGLNLGFAGGVNYALRHVALGPWVALLNPDAFPQQDWLTNLIAKGESRPAFAAFGSRMFSDADHRQLDGIGDAYHFSGLPWRSGHGCVNSARYDEECEIFAPTVQKHLRQ